MKFSEAKTAMGYFESLSDQQTSGELSASSLGGWDASPT